MGWVLATDEYGIGGRFKFDTSVDELLMLAKIVPRGK
jgi:hypothetical protein